jgi:hypothetical protein
MPHRATNEQFEFSAKLAIVATINTGVRQAPATSLHHADIPGIGVSDPEVCSLFPKVSVAQ